ncbi:MAG: DUF6527 family protein [Bacteroidota bacterium]
MKTSNRRALKIKLNGTVSNHGDAIKKNRKSGDVVIVERGSLRSLVCMCPCGCAEQITINLDIRTGKAWKMYRKVKGMSLYPSVWRDSGCKSHFIIWNNRVLWLDDDWWFEEDNIVEITKRILPLFTPDEFIHFRDIAESIEEIPWSVLRSCRELVNQGIIIEGEDEMKGFYRKI